MVVRQRTALDALSAGYDVLVAVGRLRRYRVRRTEDAAWRRLGRRRPPTSVTAARAPRLAGDVNTELGAATLGLMYENFG